MAMECKHGNGQAYIVASIFLHQCEGQKFLHQIVKVQDVTKAQDATDADAAWTVSLVQFFGPLLCTYFFCLAISFV